VRRQEVEDYYQHIKRRKLRAKRKHTSLLDEKQPRLGCSTCRKTIEPTEIFRNFDNNM
jgi:hypothetical protein